MRKKRNDGHCLYPFRIQGKDATLDPAEKEGGKRTDVAQRTDYARVRHERATVVAQQRRGKRARTQARTTCIRTRLPARGFSFPRSTRLPHTEEEKASSVEVIGRVYTGRCWILFAEDSDKRPSTSFPLATSASCDSTDTARDITLSNDTFSPLPTSSFSFAPLLAPLPGSKAS